MARAPSVARETLRRHAVSRSLFVAPDILTAVRRLGFVQADPIRAPARAQDLILRPRVTGYRVGDLEARYPSLPLAEEYLHLYGFVAAETVPLLHPRSREPAIARSHPHLRRAVLRHVKTHGHAHPRDVSARFGGGSVVNAWGGQSAATTRMLEALHYRGELVVRERDAGVKVYALPSVRRRALPPSARARALIALVVQLYAPLPLRSLRPILWQLRDRAPAPAVLRAELLRMLAQGALAQAELDGVTYVWPAGEVVPDEVPARVCLLAPFDPVVWDRRRFAQLWGWEYRFEAYTPVKKRVRGYYALPLLWRDRVIGWANATYDGALALDVGFVEARPRDRAFVRALDEARAQLEEFLRPRQSLNPRT